MNLYHNKNQYQTKLLKYFPSNEKNKFKMYCFDLILIFHNSNNRESKIT